jgi:hypothetical protein
MSSTPTTTTTDAPSSRVQSASKQPTTIENTNGTTGKTSRPPSAAQKTATETGISPGTGNEEPKVETVESSIRPPSAKVDLTPDESATQSKTSRPASARQETNEPNSHGYTIVTTGVRPPSASQNVNSRPPSASQTTAAPTTNSRPPSASQTTPTAPTTTGSRPPSASQNTAAAPTTTGSRPPSANQKVNDANGAPVGSRPSTGSQKTDTTSVNGSNSVTPRAGSRPPSANQKQGEPTANDSIVEKHTNSGVFNYSDPTLTQPIIGRPHSAAKKSAFNETDSTPTAENVTIDVPAAAEETKPVEATTTTTPRIGSAAKNQPATTTTTTENKS